MAVTIKSSLRWGELTGSVRVIVLSYPPGGSVKGQNHPINRGVFDEITLAPSPGGVVRYAIIPMVFDSEGLLRLDLPVFVRDVSPSDNVVVSLDDLDFLRDAQRSIVTTGSIYLSSLSVGGDVTAPAPSPGGGAGGLSAEQVQLAIQKALAEAAKTIKAEALAEAEAKISAAKSEAVADAKRATDTAIAAIPAPQKGVSEEQVGAIVQNAIAAIPPASGVDEAKVTQLIHAEIAKLPPTPEGGLSAAQVQSAIQTALAGASTTIKSETIAEVELKIAAAKSEAVESAKAAVAADVEAKVAAAKTEAKSETIAEVEPKIAAAKSEAVADAKRATDTAIATIPAGVTEGKVREIVDGKVPTITDNGDGTLTITTKDA